MIKTVILLSHILNEVTPLYRGTGNINLQKDKSIKNGDSCNTMIWTLPNHAGTHVDAPRHFNDSGKTIPDFEPKEWFFQKTQLCDINLNGQPRIIDADDVSNLSDCDLLLLRTGFENLRRDDAYWNNSPGLHPELADILAQKCPSLRAVGVDFISISSPLDRQLGRMAHKSFLEKNILLVEDMKLARVDAAPDLTIISPLIVEGADASPCTVFGIYYKKL